MFYYIAHAKNEIIRIKLGRFLPIHLIVCFTVAGLSQTKAKNKDAECYPVDDTGILQ